MEDLKSKTPEGLPHNRVEKGEMSNFREKGVL